MMQLQQSTITPSSRRFARRVWRSMANSTAHRQVCIFLDAELYLERVGVLEVLESLRSNGGLPELEVVFVSSENAAARHHDYVCNEDYARFIAEDVLPTNAGTSNLVCGLSLSGLAAAHIAVSYPRLFKGALCQSGSFWWNNERFASTAMGLGSGSGRIWLSVGNDETHAGISHLPTGLLQEVSQLVSVERAALTLQSLGYTVMHRVFEGGHDPEQWKAELPTALSWLLA